MSCKPISREGHHETFSRCHRPLRLVDDDVVALAQPPDRLVEPGGFLVGDPVEAYSLAYAFEGRKLGSGALDDPEPVAGREPSREARSSLRCSH